MVITYTAVIVALFLAMNIGASGAAASISIAYGSGALPKKKVALLVCGVAIFLGAVLGGSEVVKTIGSNIVPSSLLDEKVVLIILSSAALSLFIANLMGIPLSTSEITVGSVVGVGVAFKALFVKNILVIVAFWFIVPIAAFTIALLWGRGIKLLEKKFPTLKNGKYNKPITIFVIVVGFFEAFSAGMNNVANAAGPLVGAGVVSITTGVWVGGLFIAVGAIFLGGRVLQTNGKKITSFSLLEGGAISSTGATLVILASVFGLPVPLTQVTSTAIIGIGFAQRGMSIFQQSIINKIIKVWIVSPILSLVLSYGLVKIFVDTDIYTVVVLFSVSIATLGTLSLANTIKKENRTYFENSGGI
jgi:sulfate permease